MKFAQPLWLLAGLIACAALVWRYRRFDARQRVDLAKFASASLIAQLTTSVSPARRHLKRALVITGVACLAVALARPLAGFRWEEARRQGLDLMFAVDTSKSMLAQDVKPDRLTRAKMAVEDLLGKLDGDRVGLVAFAGNAFLQCPLTLDYDAFRQSLDALDTKIIPRGGTDIAAALQETEAALAGNGNNERILVLLTDGEDLEGSALDAARAAAKNGLKIFTVGVGSTSGELIPVEDEAGGTKFMKDVSGQFVKSRLDETTLKQIAEATGAMYQPLGRQAQGLETIYSQGLAKFTRHELTSRMQKVYLERFQWPLALGLLCLVLEPLVGIRRRNAAKKTAAAARPALAASWNRMARPAAAAAVALAAAVHSAQASVSGAERAFQKGDYSRAEQEYRQAAAKHPDQPVLQFNHGAAAYKSGGFDQAAQSFAKAMKTDDLTLQQDDYYNLGNTQYRLGQKTEKANAQETIKTWEQAVQSYEAALQLKSADADAKYNRDLVKRKLEELKKQQQQKQDQQKQQQNQDKNQPSQDQKNRDQKDQDKQNDQQNKQDQSKSGDKQDQSNKPNDSAGQQAKPDQKNGQGQGQPKDQPQQAAASKGQDKPADKKTPPEKQNDSSGQPDQPAQANQKPEPKDQIAQAGQKPDEQKQDGTPQPLNPQSKNAGPEQADARPGPGQMSREEAKQLLDSLKSDDRKMPLTPATRGNESAQNDEPAKDW
jgi:Ca-activated chloride channel family protein